MIRGYDTSALHWKDEILRIRHLEAEIADLQKGMEEIKRRLEKPRRPCWWWVQIDAEGRTGVVSGKPKGKE